MEGVAHWLATLGAGGAGAWLAARFYLMPPPRVFQPSTPAPWPPCQPPGRSPGGGDGDGSEVLRCVQINVWSGSTYELEPAGASTLYHLLWGRFGSFEPEGQAAERYRALVSELRRLRPSIVCVNEADSEAWVRQLAEDLGLASIWHPGVAVVRLGPVALPPGIEEGDAILFHPQLQCEHAARRALSGSVWGSRLAANFGDATQALSVRLRTPAGRRLFVLGTHWRATLIEDEVGSQEAEALASAYSGKDGERVRAAGERLLREGSKMRLEESAGVVAELRSRAAADADGVIVLGDLNTTRGTAEVRRLLEEGQLRDAWAGNAADGATWSPSNPHVAHQIHVAVRTLPYHILTHLCSCS